MPKPISENIADILKLKGTGPFLFVGSGLSRRYIGLEDWAGLLSHFCGSIKDFNYYYSKSNGNLPSAATLMAADFHEVWWSLPEFDASRRSFGDMATQISSPLKFEIARYIDSKDLTKDLTAEALLELPRLQTLNVDGIITTNWDRLLEKAFPEYSSFIGQKELLFSNAHGIAEIYKIHGCTSQPDSLVLTQEDYADFEKRNPYLAAKLITIFVEHPVIFIGYSVSDPHIQAIIASIAKCVGQEKIAAFQENLIFLNRSTTGREEVVEHHFRFDDTAVSVRQFLTNDFGAVFSAISANKRKLPAKFLRFFREQVYELVKNVDEPNDKIAVVDFADVESEENIEFVIGVGVAKEQRERHNKLNEIIEKQLAGRGYAGISPQDVFRDYLSDAPDLQPEPLLDIVYPIISRNSNRFIPVFKYLRAIGIENANQLATSNYEGAKRVAKKLQMTQWGITGYRQAYLRNYREKSTRELIETSDPSNAIMMLLHQPCPDLDDLLLS